MRSRRVHVIVNGVRLSHIVEAKLEEVPSSAMVIDEELAPRRLHIYAINVVRCLDPNDPQPEPTEHHQRVNVFCEMDTGRSFSTEVIVSGIFDDEVCRVEIERGVPIHVGATEIGPVPEEADQRFIERLRASMLERQRPRRLLTAAEAERIAASAEDATRKLLFFAGVVKGADHEGS